MEKPIRRSLSTSREPLPEAEKEKYKNYRYGRMTCYGVTLQLYNATDNQEAQLTEKKMKGLSLPIGEISFDLNFQSNVTSGGQSFDGSDTEYTPILWEYNENVPANSSFSYTYKDPDMQSENGGTVTTPKDGLGNSGRNLYWTMRNVPPTPKAQRRAASRPIMTAAIMAAPGS